MYNWLKYAYPKGCATEDQCRRAVELEEIDAIQFKEITGIDY